MIELKNTLNQKTIDAFTRFYSKKLMRIAWLVSAVCLPVGVALVLLGVGLDTVGSALLIFGALYPLLMFVVSFITKKRGMQVNNLVGRKIDYTLSFDELGLTAESFENDTQIESTKIFWKNIYEVHITYDCIYIYINKINAHILPDICYTSGDKTELIQLCFDNMDKNKIKYFNYKTYSDK